MQFARLACVHAAFWTAVRCASAVDADVPAAAFDEDDACQNGGVNGTCDVSLRQLRATQKQRHLEASGSMSAEQLQALLAQGNGISTGGKAEQVHMEGRGQVLKLYHQTSQQAAESIMQTGFRLGHDGICGPAIYFSPSPKDTDVKAVGGRGYIIEAQVDMGRIKYENGLCDKSITPGKMQQWGFDSIELDRGGFMECWMLPHCYEYIVYDKSRILSMKTYPYNGMTSWFPWFTPPWMQPVGGTQAGGTAQQVTPSGNAAEVVPQAAVSATPPPAAQAAPPPTAAPAQQAAPPPPAATAAPPAGK